MIFYSPYIRAEMLRSYKWIGLGMGWMGWMGSLCGAIVWAPLCGANNGIPVLHIRIWYTGRQRGMERFAQIREREENKCETNVLTNMKEIQQEIWQENTVVWKAQMRGREKSSSTAAPSALVRGWSMRKCEITCGESQFCAELSTFN